ncbi:MAG: nucleotidyltransferase domain-containing protein [Methylococcaceae bacterium]|nr:nucleotidyltransferase domain-containing protein [Methylococcaceae bacterium]
MRLTEQEKNTIIRQIKQTLSDQLDFDVWLFGSRVDDALKGGDVDLCLIIDEPIEKLFSIKLKLRPLIEEAIDLPVDLIMQSKGQKLKLVTQKAIQTGIRLN